MTPRIVVLTVIGLIISGSLALAGDRKIIIGFRHKPGLNEHAKHEKVFRAGGMPRRSHTFINAVSAQVPEEQISIMKRDPDIAYVEEDKLVSYAEPATSSAEYADAWGVQHIGADAAVKSGIRGSGIKVAVLDTGIDYNHPDLKDNYKGGYNFAYDNDDPYDDSRQGHGTHIAGIIAARDNGTGVVGVAPDASLYAVKVLNGGLLGSTSDILAGIEWAISNGMHVINMSFGIPSDPANYSRAVEEACQRAFDAGIILIAAAGNANQQRIDYTAAFSSVVAVSATTREDTRAAISNYGEKIELCAPGDGITSTIPGGGYGTLNGSSQASAHVAGVAALMLSVRKEPVTAAAADNLRQQLISTARDLGESGRDIYFGYGLVQAPRASTDTTVQHPGRRAAHSKNFLQRRSRTAAHNQRKAHPASADAGHPGNTAVPAACAAKKENGPKNEHVARRRL